MLQPSKIPGARSCRLPLLLLCSLFLALFPSALLAQRHKHATPTPSPTPTPTATPTPDDAAANLGPALPDPVATIDGDAIHPKDLQRVAGALLESNGRTLSELTDAERKKAYASILDDMITDRLVARQAANETVPDVEVEKRFNDLRNQYGANFDAEMKKSGQTADQIRHNIHTQVAQQQWIEAQIAPDIKVTPAEVEKFYKESPPNRFDTPEMVRASHILVAVRRDAPPEEAVAAETKINDLAARIKKGESFETLAKQYSDDPKAKETSGDLDYFSRERIMPEFADAAFKLKVGEVSPPVRTQFGYHLIKLTDRKPAHTASLDEAREQITAYLQDEKRRIAISKVLQQLRDAAKIQVFLDQPAANAPAHPE